MEIQELIRNNSNLFKHESYLDILIEVERHLDNFHLYVYDNWIDGQVVQGPKVTRYWVEIVLMFPMDAKPDMEAAKTLIKHGIKVFTRTGILKTSVPPENDYEIIPPEKRTVKEDVFFVKLFVPTKYVTEVNFDRLGFIDTEINLEDLEKAAVEGIESEEDMTGEGT